MVLDSEGECWEGDFENDKLKEALIHYANGDVFLGNYNKKTDKREGDGTYLFSNGDMYTGEWRNNLKDGLGIEYYADGSEKTCEFAKDKILELICHYDENGKKL